MWIENNNEYKEYKKPKDSIDHLEEVDIFKKAQAELEPIQQNLLEKKMTIDEAKQELQQINEWLQWANIENRDKRRLNRAFDKLLKLEENVDELSLKEEVDKIDKLLDKLTKSDLRKLRNEVILANHGKTSIDRQRIINRKPDVQEWIAEASNNLVNTVDEAAKESGIAWWAWRAMRRALWEDDKLA